MTFKRKLDLIVDDYVHTSRKQLKSDADMSMDVDVVMSDSPSESPEPSPASSYTSLPSPQYPAFQLYPKTPSEELKQPAFGLMQPHGFTHNNRTCTQIPKLRVACEAGMGERRTMWTICEECGAVAMVD